jgi:hypothetical protein
VTHARAMALQEMLLPAVSVQRGWELLGTWDRRAGSLLRGKLDATQQRLFGPLDDIHRLRFEDIEEDEFVLWGIFASVMCANDAPSSTESRALDDLRNFEGWSEARQARALGYYRACVLKKIYREPASDPREPVWVVSKNPAFTHKTRALRNVFPDARFIYLVRHPLETIPSRLSLIRAIWTRRFPTFQRMSSAQVRVILQDSLRTYQSAERDLGDLPANRCCTVLYTDLMSAPRATVESIYRTLELPGPDPHLAAELARMQGRSRHESAHRYALDEFGLDPESLRGDLAPILLRYGFV